MDLENLNMVMEADTKGNLTWEILKEMEDTTIKIIFGMDNGKMDIWKGTGNKSSPRKVLMISPMPLSMKEISSRVNDLGRESLCGMANTNTMATLKMVSLTERALLNLRARFMQVHGHKVLN